MNHIEYLKRYQSWRTGELDMTMDEAGISPAELTNAINKAIADAERYLFASQSGLMLVGGGRKFNWPIAPIGKSQWDKYIDAALSEANK